MDTQTRIQWVRRLGVIVVAMTFSIMVVGSWVKATGSGLSCPDWPQCYGEWLPPFPSAETGGTDPNAFDHADAYSQAQVMYEWAHRFLVTLLAPVMLAFAGLAFFNRVLHPAVRTLPAVAGFVLLAQIGIGGATVIQGNPALVTTLHLATATLFFMLVTMATMFVWLRPTPVTDQASAQAPAAGFPGEPASAASAATSSLESESMTEAAQPAARQSIGAIAKDFMEISKPRIMLLLLVVAWSAMFVADRGLPPWEPFLAVTAAGILSTAAAGAFNHVIEKERDGRMGRTASRPVASGRVSVPAALVYASVCTILSVVALVALSAWLAAALTLGAIAYYIVVYTVWLKPTTPQNIVIGGFAGSFPALIGWSAMTGTIGWAAWIIAGLVFLWTPPHFWSLALLYKHDYAAADYPMYPNVKGEEATRKQILFYSILTVLGSLVLVYPLGVAGWLYVVGAVALGIPLIRGADGLMREPNPKAYRKFFLFTIQYLGLLLVALMVDQVAYFSVA